ncbi:MAG: beta-glucosidase, partial [Rhodospirillaceae bacterium]|nr:beta-glucosidase [Rhodospirillaceae bacterium]
MTSPTDSGMTAFIDALLAQMTLAEKLGQINLVTTNIPVNPDRIEDIRAGKIGGLLGGLVDCGFGIDGPGPLRRIQEMAVKESRLGSPLLLAEDVVHGQRSGFPIPLGVGGW